jgi:hypothetical protein
VPIALSEALLHLNGIKGLKRSESNKLSPEIACAFFVLSFKFVWIVIGRSFLGI